MIRPLTPLDAPAFVVLRRAALDDAPLAFAASPEDDVAGSVESVAAQLGRGPDFVILGAFRGEALEGAAGLYRDRHRKACHKAHIWGMYVRPDARRGGLGAALINAAVEHARTLGVDWVQLSVSAAAADAKRLYERLGFRVWGVEPDALRHEGRAADEHHMALRL
jgi:ribosomal protein S18 acetylase RimI-like enzyme